MASSKKAGFPMTIHYHTTESVTLKTGLPRSMPTNADQNPGIDPKHLIFTERHAQVLPLVELINIDRQ